MTIPTLPRSVVVKACADMIQACGVTLVEIADELDRRRPLALPVSDGVDIDAVHAARPTPAPEPAAPFVSRPLTEASERALSFVRRPAGVTVLELSTLMQTTTSMASWHLTQLGHRGFSFGVRQPGSNALRHFAEKAHADAWLEAAVVAKDVAPPVGAAAQKPAPAPAPRVALSEAEQRGLAVHAAKVAGSKKAPPPMGKRTTKPAPHQAITITPPKIDDSRMRPSGEAIITADTKITRDTAARPTARWQMRQEAPDERWPSFAAARPGIDPSTGKAWEPRA